MRHLTAAILVLLSFNAVGGVLMANGVGMHRCGKYLEYRKQNNQVQVAMYQQWGSGFLAGYSSAKPKDTNTNIATELETITAWADKWCTENPLSQFIDAMFSLRTQLELQSK